MTTTPQGISIATGVLSILLEVAFLREWRATVVGAVLAAGLVFAATLGKLDVVRVNAGLLDKIEKYQIDDIVVGLSFVFAGITTDRWISGRRKRREAEIEEHRLRVLKATMRTVQDIVNNFLNNLQMFRFEADGLLPEDRLRAFDELVAGTARELQALGDLEAVQEKEMAAGEGIAYAKQVSSL